MNPIAMPNMERKIILFFIELPGTLIQKIINESRVFNPGLY
jgi:hypothetical protein